MRYYALACDYDGTIATDGKVDAATWDALTRLKASGRKLLLVTGRELEDLQRVLPAYALFDLIVVENGALLFDPKSHEEQSLGPAPPPAFVAALRARAVTPLSVGRVIVATWEPHETAVLETIRDLGLDLQVIFNKGAVMILPSGINKATGLHAALARLGLSAHNVVSVGDAENDHAFLSVSEFSVAVANALPAVKERVDWVTDGARGAGAAQVCEALLKDDLRSRDHALARHVLPLGHDRDDIEIGIPAYGTNVLLSGTSGSGKSTFALSLLERLHERGYQYCIVDPEGDYENFEDAVVLGDAKNSPTVAEALKVLERPERNAVVNLLGIALDHRPAFFQSLLPALLKLRADTGRPHWIVVDETHHLLPKDWLSTGAEFPAKMHGMVFITVHPDQVAPVALKAVDFMAAIGEAPDDTFARFARSVGRAAPARTGEKLASGEAVGWWCRRDAAPFWFRSIAPQAEHKRHIRKYASGDLGDHSFYFRGADGKLNLRAQNLTIFMQIADGVDDATWDYHLQRGEYSRWFRECVKDTELAEAAAAIEGRGGLAPKESRRLIRAEIEQRYTAPA